MYRAELRSLIRLKRKQYFTRLLSTLTENRERIWHSINPDMRTKAFHFLCNTIALKYFIFKRKRIFSTASLIQLLREMVVSPLLRLFFQ